MVQYGLTSTPSQYRRLIQRFIRSYLGSDENPVPFGGRQSQLAKMNAWFSDVSAPQNLLITADAGRGKTALLVRWLEQLDTKVQKIFLPISIRYETNRPAFFYQALAARLAEIAGETLTTSATDAAAHYRERVIEYCDLLESRNEPCLLVIDGLDEANGWSFSESVIGDVCSSTMRIVAAARLMIGDADERGWLRRLGWSNRGDEAASILIPPLNNVEIADVLRFSNPQFEILSQNQEILSLLEHLTLGDPLLLTYYVEDLHALTSTDQQSVLEHLSGKTEGFGAFFDDWLLKQGGLVSQHGAAIEDQAIKKILAILASALGPLSMRDMEQLVARAFGNDTLISRDTLQPLRRFIIGDGNANGFALCHPKLRDFLRKDYFGGSSIVTTADAAFLSWGQETIAALRNKVGDMALSSRYLRRHFAQHLNEADVGLDAYFDLLDLGWRKAWEADQEGDGLRGFKNDAETAFEAFKAAYLATDGRDPIAFTGLLNAALVLSVINSLSDNVPDDLIVEALKRDRIALGQALMFAQRSDPFRTMTSMGRLLQATPENTHDYICDAALETLRSVSKEEEVQHGVAAIAPYLDADQQLDVLDLATALRSEWRLAGSIQGLAAYALPESLSIMVAVSCQIRDMWARANGLLALVPYVDGTHFETISQAARKISDAEVRSNLLIHLAAKANGSTREALLADARHWVDRILQNDRFVVTLAALLEVQPDAMDAELKDRLIFGEDAELDAYRAMFRLLGSYLDDDFLTLSLARCLAPSTGWIEEWDDDDDIFEVCDWIKAIGAQVLPSEHGYSNENQQVWQRIFDLIPRCEKKIVEKFPENFNNLLPDVVNEALTQIQANMGWASGAVYTRGEIAKEPTSYGVSSVFSTLPGDVSISSAKKQNPSEELGAILQRGANGMSRSDINICLRLLPDVPDALATQAIDAAFLAALAPGESGDIEVCCKRLPEFLPLQNVEFCLDLALITSEEYSRSQALGALVPHLSNEKLKIIQSNAESMSEFRNRMYLHCVIAQLESDDVRRALHLDFMDQIAERDVKNDIDVGVDLTTLRRFLDPDLQKNADIRFGQNVAQDEPSESQMELDQNAILSEVRKGTLWGRGLEDYRRRFENPNRNAFAELLTAVQTCEDLRKKTSSLCQIATWIDGKEREDLIAEAFGLLNGFTINEPFYASEYTAKPERNAELLGLMAPFMAVDQLLAGFDFAWSVLEEDFSCLEVILPHLAVHMAQREFPVDEIWPENRLMLPLLFAPPEIAEGFAPSGNPLFDVLGRHSKIFMGSSLRANETGGLQMIRLLVPFLSDVYCHGILAYIKSMISLEAKVEAALEVALAKSSTLRNEAINLVLDALPKIDPHDWYETLDMLGPILSPQDSERLLKLAKAVPDDTARQEVLRIVWEVMPANLRPQTMVARMSALSLLPRLTTFRVLAHMTEDLASFGQDGAKPEVAERMVGVLGWWRI